MRPVLSLSSIVFLACLAACSGASPSARNSQDFAGRWVLQSVDGAALPFATSQSSTAKSEIVSDVIRAQSNASFTDTMTVRTTDNGQVTSSAVPRSGVWVLEGGTVTFTFFDDGQSTTAAFAGTALTVSAAGRRYVYASR